MSQLPRDWESILTRNITHYRLICDSQKKRLQKDIPNFIRRKFWHGCAGMEITDEVRVTIAAQACLMLLGLSHDYFKRVRSILIYPSSFTMSESGEAAIEDLDGDMISWRQGESHSIGPVILAWDSVLEECKDPRFGQNLVIHEFAHQLDMLDGDMDGTPDLSGDAARRWNAMLDSEFKRLIQDIQRGRRTFLGEYAASSKAEFFAVASERFFTLPHDLHHYHPELFELLVKGYAINPGEWFKGDEQVSVHE